MNVDEAESILSQFDGQDGAMLPALHALQARFGYVPPDTVPLIAARFNLSRAEVHGTISFYHDFRKEPAGRHVLKLCRAEACQAVGARDLHSEAQRRLGIDWHGTTADGRITIEPVFCLGLCASGPAGLLDDAPLARLDADSLAAHLAELPE